MIRGVFVFILSLVFLLSLFLSALAETPSKETDLKEEIKGLLKRIEELEKKQSDIETKTSESEKRPAEEKTLQAGYDNGFYIKTPDGNYSLKLNLLLQFRYTYLNFDKRVNANSEDWSNFLLRRARLFLRGNAPNKDWTYYFYIQLEPQSAVNLHDGYITYKRYPYAEVQIGRAKIPYGLEFWNSASQLNGIERTIFSGETDVDGRSDIRKWPGGNANFPTSDEDSITKFPIGGLNLFRSQGVHLQGDINSFNQKGFLQYWLGLYNGRNTKGSPNSDNSMLYVGRVSINPFGKYNLSQQGDIDYSREPKLCLLISGMQYKDRLTQYRDIADNNNDGYGDHKTAGYDIKAGGYNLSALFRYHGFSFDGEYGYEHFKQDRSAGHTWDRYGYRFNAGYFLIPKKLEVIARYAYLERLKDNTTEKSLSSGLGLVSFNGGTNNAIEDNLQEYTAGLNYYLMGHRLKLFIDYSVLIRELKDSIIMASLKEQQDTRFRAMFQFFF